MSKKFDPKKFKKLRAKSRLSLEALAGKLVAAGCEVSYGTVRYWEIGRTIPNANELNALAEIFQSRSDDLCSHSVAPKACGLLLAALLSSGAALAGSPEWSGVIVHISDSSHMTQDECNDWHNARGWDGCGYNFVVEPDGRIYAARGWNKVGAHTVGYNSRNLGFCFVTKDTATPAQLEAFKRWYFEAQEIYGRLPLYPHRQFNSGKSCPAGTWNQLNGVI